MMRRMESMGAPIVGVWFAAMLIAAPLAAAPRDDVKANGPAAIVVVQPLALERGMRESAAMVLVGTALIGLAAAVRRAA